MSMSLFDWQSSENTNLNIQHVPEANITLDLKSCIIILLIFFSPPATTAPAAGSYPQQQYGGVSQAYPPQYYSVRPLEMQ